MSHPSCLRPTVTLFSALVSSWCCQHLWAKHRPPHSVHLRPRGVLRACGDARTSWVRQTPQHAPRKPKMDIYIYMCESSLLISLTVRHSDRFLFAARSSSFTSHSNQHSWRCQTAATIGSPCSVSLQRSRARKVVPYEMESRAS